MTVRFLCYGLLLFSSLIPCVGCGRGGETRSDLTGIVTYDGKPLPGGYIVFAPDAVSGNIGPGTQAGIQNGRYRTPPGQGSIGGPHRVTITGFDGTATMDNPIQRQLFANFQIKVDLPRNATTQDFAVPRGGGDSMR